MTYVVVSANQRTRTLKSIIFEHRDYERLWEGVPWKLTLDTYWVIYIRPFLSYGYGSW